MTQGKRFAIAGVIVAFLGAIFLVVSGKDITYNVDFSGESSDKIRVGGLVKTFGLETGQDGEIYEIENWTMLKDTVDLKIKTPENIEDYSKLVFSAEFQNPDNPTFEIGVRKEVDKKLGEKIYDWKYHYLDNKYLNSYKDYLGEDWSMVEDKDKGLTLFQEGKSYNTVDDFLSNPPKKDTGKLVDVDEEGTTRLVYKDIPKIATVDYVLEQKYNFDELNKEENSDENGDETTISNTTTIPFTLRGNLDMFVYFDKNIADQLQLDFVKQDRNAADGLDQYEIKVFNYKRELVYYKILDDDGITDKSKLIDMQTFRHTIDLKESGGYLIKFVYQDDSKDSFIRNIQVNMPKVLIDNFTVVDQVNFLADNLITKPMTFYAKKGLMSLIPDNERGNQDIMLNGLQYTINRQDKRSNFFSLEDDINEITTTINNLQISHSSNFVALSKNALFDMFPNRTMEYQSNDFQSSYEFLISDYNIPETKNGHEISIQEFPLDNVYIDEDGFIHMKLRASGLAGYDNQIKLSNIKVSLKN